VSGLLVRLLRRLGLGRDTARSVRNVPAVEARRAPTPDRLSAGFFFARSPFTLRCCRGSARAMARNSARAACMARLNPAAISRAARQLSTREQSNSKRAALLHGTPFVTRVRRTIQTRKRGLALPFAEARDRRRPRPFMANLTGVRANPRASARPQNCSEASWLGGVVRLVYVCTLCCQPNCALSDR
jgi:hypothetical protein